MVLELPIYSGLQNPAVGCTCSQYRMQKRAVEIYGAADVLHSRSSPGQQAAKLLL